MKLSELERISKLIDVAAETRVEGPQGMSFNNVEPFMTSKKIKELLAAFVEKETE